MELSASAQQLLRFHAETPNRLVYGVGILGSMFREADIDRLDKAYQELENAHLMKRAGPIVSYFGDPKFLYKVTPEGEKAAREVAV